MGTRRAPTGDLANSIGVDVMRIHIPENESFPTFLESLEATVCLSTTTGVQITDLPIQLTPGEQAYLLNLSPANGAALTALFELWTIKESYTKALGSGLGFDFSRVEYDFQTRILSIDGQALCGWCLGVFHFEVEGDKYVGATCHRLEEKSTSCVVETLNIQGAPWCRCLSASQVIEEAVPFVR
jgi:4'-phosphopantetheinyl transferase